MEIILNLVFNMQEDSRGNNKISFPTRGELATHAAKGGGALASLIKLRVSIVNFHLICNLGIYK